MKSLHPYNADPIGVLLSAYNYRPPQSDSRLCGGALWVSRISPVRQCLLCAHRGTDVNVRREGVGWGGVAHTCDDATACDVRTADAWEGFSRALG